MPAQNNTSLLQEGGPSANGGRASYSNKHKVCNPPAKERDLSRGEEHFTASHQKIILYLLMQATIFGSRLRYLHCLSLQIEVNIQITILQFPSRNGRKIDIYGRAPFLGKPGPYCFLARNSDTRQRKCVIGNKAACKYMTRVLQAIS